MTDKIIQLAALQQGILPEEQAQLPEPATVIRSGEELVSSDVPEPDTIVDPFLLCGTVTLFYAKPKVGKTFVGLELLQCVSNGQPFLDYKVPKPVGALFLDGELGLRQLKARVEKIGHGPGARYLNAGEFGQKAGHALDLTRADHQQWILDYVLAEDLALVIVDNLSCLVPRKDENDNTDPGLLSFFGLCNRLKANCRSVVLIHHAGHDGRHPRGASVVQSYVDTVIALKKTGANGELVEMEFTHTRDKCPDPPQRTFQIKDGGDVITLDVVGGAKHQPAHDLLPFLLKGDHQSQKALANAVGKSVGAVNAWLKKLRGEGLVEKKGLGLTADGMKLAKSMS